MRAVLQRVDRASVSVGGESVSRIGRGILILLSVGKDDTEADARYLAGKAATARIIEDEDSKFNLSVLDDGGEALVVSQFTLHGDLRRGRRPSFDAAAPAETAQALYESFCEHLRVQGVPTRQGIFAASMAVELVNRGPVTILIDSKKTF